MFGSIVACLFSGIIGFIIGKIYLIFANNPTIDLLCFNKNNGNILTVVSLIFSFIGYIRDIISVFEDNVRMREIKQS